MKRLSQTMTYLVYIYICQMLAVKTTLQKVHIYHYPTITISGKQQLSTELTNNRTLTIYIMC